MEKFVLIREHRKIPAEFRGAEVEIIGGREHTADVELDRQIRVMPWWWLRRPLLVRLLGLP